MIGRCITCEEEFEYYPSNQRGKYCSLKCRDNDPDYVNPMKGKKRPDLSEYNKKEKPKQIGELNPNWKDGISLLNVNKHIRTTKEYKEWRLKVLERDGNKCRLCLSDKELEVHHVVPLRWLVEDDYELYEVENGVVVCLECHSKIDKFRGRFNEKRIH